MANQKGVHAGTASGCTSGCSSMAWRVWQSTRLWSICSISPNAQKNTNPIAHALLEKFGDLAGVLEASEEDLCSVEGVGPASARLLHLLPQVSAYYHRSRTRDRRRMKTTEDLGAYAMARFQGISKERVLLICLSRQRRITYTAWLGQGMEDRVSLPVQEAISQALRVRAESRRPVSQPPRRQRPALPAGPGGHRRAGPGDAHGGDRAAGSSHRHRHRIHLPAPTQRDACAAGGQGPAGPSAGGGNRRGPGRKNLKIFPAEGRYTLYRIHRMWYNQRR